MSRAAIWAGLSLYLLFSRTSLAGDSSAEEMPWDVLSPEALQDLEQMPDEQRDQLLDTYQSLSPEEQATMRDSADELRALSPEEQAWLLENQETARKLGQLPEDQRRGMLERYRRLSPEMQQAVRKRAGGHGSERDR